MRRSASAVVLLSLILVSLTGCGNTAKTDALQLSVSNTSSSSTQTSSSSQIVTSSSQTASSSQMASSSSQTSSSASQIVASSSQTTPSSQMEPSSSQTESSSSQEAPAQTGREGFSILEISDDLFYSMKAGNTYKSDCIVPREDLRYLLVLHKDKDGITHQGEMVVHKLIAEDVLEIFEGLYDAGYPIEKMVLPENYMADDEMMMRDNNSSCFNFRFMSNSTGISKHGLGMAIDINTLYNPYQLTVTDDDGSVTEVIEPATGAPYLDRTQDFDYKIERGDLCYNLFIEKGFEWGGDWSNPKDYQHFEMPTYVTDKYSEMYQ